MRAFAILLLIHSISASLLATQGVEFNGTNYISVPNLHKLGVADEVTVEFWAKTSLIGGHQAFQASPDDNFNRFSGQISYGGPDAVYWDRGDINSGDGRQGFDAPFPTPGRWIHWAMISSKAGNFMRTYMNGELVIEKSGHASFNPNGNGLTGYELKIGLDMLGSMEEFRMWNVVRSPAAIRADMHRTLAGTEAGLRLYFKFDSLLTNSAKATGAAYNGTAVGSIVTAFPLQRGNHFVTNTNDSGPGSLRAAVASAEAADTATPGPQRISFSPALSGKSIQLGSNLTVSTFGDGLTIDASALPLGITVVAAPESNSRHFTVSSGSELNLNRMVLTGASDSSIRVTGSRLVLTDCTLRGNQNALSGGAIYAESTSSVELNRCTFSGNEAVQQYGGALFLSGTQALITRCTFSGNLALDGGAIEMGSNVNCTLRYCTLAYNICTRDGGAIDHYTSTSSLSLQDCVLSWNEDEVGFQDLYITSGAATSVVNALALGAALQGGGSMSGPIPINGQVNLGPLAANGGFTHTHELQAAFPVANNPGANDLRQMARTDQRGLKLRGGQDLGAFEIQAGTRVAFSTASHSVFEGQATALLFLTRAGDPSTAFSVNLKSTPGTASATDFTALTTTVSFAANELSKIVTLSTVNDSLVEPNELLTLSLSAPTAGALLGSPAICTVVIADPSSTNLALDLADPSAPVVTSHKNQAVVKSQLPGFITLSGTAKDNKAVTAVSVFSAASNLTVFAALQNRLAPSTTWSVQVPAVPGVMPFTIRTFDASSRASSATSLTLNVQTPLKVYASGDGSFTPGFYPESFREIGKPYTITATARPGAIFAGWSIGGGWSSGDISATDLSHPTLSFIHRPELALKATFIPSPFIGSSATGYVGTFIGSIRANTAQPDRAPTGPGPEDGTVPGMSTQGLLSVTVQSNASFTGKLLLDAKSYPVSGLLDVNFIARFGPNRTTSLSIPRPGKNPLFFSMNHTPGTLYATVSQYDANGLQAQSDVTAVKSSATKTSPVSSSYVGPYTAFISLTGFANSASLPGGKGFLTLRLSELGILSYSGKLPDGSAITGSTVVSDLGIAPFFSTLYAGKGLFSDFVRFDLGPVGSDFASIPGLDGTWVRPVLDSQYYPAGWPSGTPVSITGNKHTVPGPGVSAIPGLTAVDGNGNANINFTFGKLSSSRMDSLNITTSDAVTAVTTTAAPTLVINRSTGAISGSFLHTDGSRVKYEGILFAPGPEKAWGYFLSTAPKVKDYLGQSGSVFLYGQ